MFYKGLYSITGIIMILGFLIMLYGIHIFSLSIFIEGFFLLWIGFSLTANMMEHQRLDVLQGN